MFDRYREGDWDFNVIYDLFNSLNIMYELDVVFDSGFEEEKRNLRIFFQHTFHVFDDIDFLE